jgi:hypothetical protein
LVDGLWREMQGEDVGLAEFDVGQPCLGTALGVRH